MNETIKLLLSLSLSGSILAIIIYAMKPFIKHKLSKTIQYYIWMVVLLRLVLPFSFETSIMNEIFYGNQTPLVISTQNEVQPGDAAREGAISTSIGSNVHENVKNGVYNNDADHSRYFQDLFNQYALYLWLMGIIVTLAMNMIGYVRFLKHLQLTNKPVTAAEKKHFDSLLKGQKNVAMVRNPFVSTPMLIGIRRPCIIIPDIDFTEKQLENILLHEISHLKRFDIGIKWLTMIAASIHWFNPMMYFIKKEINHACELACDETVIKNLGPAEKQAYGETLISVVAEHKYPVGVLQATLSEEKKSLKERLVAIMYHNQKSKIITIISGILFLFLLAGSIYLGAGVGFGQATPPQIYISAEGQTTKAALMGSYSWEYRGNHILADAANPIDFDYKADNHVSVTGKKQLILGTQKMKYDKKYDFTMENILVYKDGKLIEFETVEPSYMNGNLYIQAPPNAGQYIYHLTLNFKDKGIVNYGFAVSVDKLSYDLTEIAKYKTAYVGDNSKVAAIASLLPVPDNSFMQRYIAMETSQKPYRLTVYYELATAAKYAGAWPILTRDSVIEENASANALVAFCMIDNLDEITFAFRNSQSNGKLDAAQYDMVFTFQRASFEKIYGDLAIFGENLDLLQAELNGR